MKELKRKSIDAPDTTIKAKGEEIEVSFPLEVRTYCGGQGSDSYVQCCTANGLEVWYFHEDEYKLYGSNIARMTATSMVDPEKMVEVEAVHIASDWLTKNR